MVTLKSIIIIIIILCHFQRGRSVITAACPLYIGFKAITISRSAISVQLVVGNHTIVPSKPLTSSSGTQGRNKVVWNSLPAYNKYCDWC